MNADDLAERVREGDLRLHELESHADPDTAAAARRRVVASETDTSLDSVGESHLAAADTDSTIENLVGTVEIPMGVAGPVPVAGGEREA
ncbi:3-hydroxy-3-methylglutaryl-CoA reductase, partial [Halococcus sp. IIIV-5B]